MTAATINVAPSPPPAPDAAIRETATRRAPTRRAAPPSAWIGVAGVAVAAVWLGAIGWRDLSGAGDLTTALRAAHGQMVAPALVVAVAAIFLAERRWPVVPRPALARAHLVDAGYLLLFATVVAPLVTLIDTGFAVAIERHAHFLVLSRWPLIPQFVVVAAILVAMDAMNWLAHVANHRSRALWRLHALHHSQEELSVFTTFRTHPLMHASYLPALLPALVLGAGGTVPSAALIAYSCLVTLPHANLGWTFGRLGRVVVSPSYHRLHHARAPLGDWGAVNFGFVLVWWDRLARCAVYPDGSLALPTGLAGRPVPVEQAGPAHGIARSPGVIGIAGIVGAQLVQPFRWHAATDGQP